MRILITGVAGFIGMHAAQALLKEGHKVYGIDNLNSYYDPALKRARLAQIDSYPNFQFDQIDICETVHVAKSVQQFHPSHVLHLAAQAGVRYSLENPRAYVDSNVVGFLNILEACRRNSVQHLAYASSSSVYGGNENVPFTETDIVDHPVSLYAATKKANELMAHTYSHLYGLPTTGLRFFTVYGPWGRPDMAPWLFADAILNGRSIKVFNNGQLRRDFTYIDDIVDCTCKVLLNATPTSLKKGNPLKDQPPYRILNIGNSQPVELESFISTIEKALGKKAVRQYLPMQDGDVLETYANTNALTELIGCRPSTPLEEGIEKFAAWFRGYTLPPHTSAK